MHAYLDMYINTSLSDSWEESFICICSVSCYLFKRSENTTKNQAEGRKKHHEKWETENGLKDSDGIHMDDCTGMKKAGSMLCFVIFCSLGKEYTTYLGDACWWSRSQPRSWYFGLWWALGLLPSVWVPEWRHTVEVPLGQLHWQKYLFPL